MGRVCLARVLVPRRFDSAGFRGLLPRCAAGIYREGLRTTHGALPAPVLRPRGRYQMGCPLPPPTPPPRGGPRKPHFRFSGLPPCVALLLLGKRAKIVVMGGKRGLGTASKQGGPPDPAVAALPGRGWLLPPRTCARSESAERTAPEGRPGGLRAIAHSGLSRGAPSRRATSADGHKRVRQNEERAIARA